MDLNNAREPELTGRTETRIRKIAVEKLLEKLSMEEAIQETAPAPVPVSQPQEPPLANNPASLSAPVMSKKELLNWGKAEADDLLTSDREGYPAEVQPRNRGRVASRQQIEGIISNLDPSRLADNRMASDGAPIVGADDVVESGNGRVMAVREAYRRGAADNYRQYLIDNAETLGLSKDAIENMKNPVLVRERVTDVDRVKFAQEANESSVSAMSESETAARDARNMDTGILENAAKNPDLMTNTAFFRDFFEYVVPQSERGQFIDQNGRISQAGYRRVRNALAAKAYGDDSVISRMAESTDDNIRNVNRALVQAAPSVALVQGGIERGALREDLSISRPIIEAANTLSFLRGDGTKVSEFLDQRNLFDDEDISPEARKILQFFDKNKQKPNVMTSFLTDIAKAVEGQGAANQKTLFDDGGTETLSDIIDRTVDKYAPSKARQTSLFGDEGQAGGNFNQALPDISASAPKPQKGNYRPREVPDVAKAISFSGRTISDMQHIAKDRLVNELAKNPIETIDGSEVYFAPGENEDWDSYTKHLIYGRDGLAPNPARAKSLWLVEDTVKNPVTIIKQKNGNKAYISLYEGDKEMAHHIVVQVEADGRARTITSLISKDTGTLSTKASNYIDGQLRNAGEIIYLEGAIDKRGDYRAPEPTSEPASSGGVPLHEAGTDNISQSDDDFNENIQSLPHVGDRPGAPSAPPHSDRSKSVTMRDIREKIEKLLPWRRGKTGQNLGIFKVDSEVARTKLRNDVDVAAHELGQFLDKKFGLSDLGDADIQSELMNAGQVVSRKNYTDEQIRKEGVAQFIRYYMSNDAEARANFPRVYDAFLDALEDTDPGTRADIEAIKELVTAYLGQTPEERLDAHTVSGTDAKSKSLSEIKDRAYGQMVDAKDPLRRVTEEVKKKLGVEHLENNLNLYARAMTAPGYKGKADRDLGRFLDVVKNDLRPEDHAELVRYLEAARAQNYRWNDLLPGLGTSAEEEAAIMNGASDRIKNAALAPQTPTLNYH
ncbi:MAG: hypothetical protein LBG12_00635 [Synergistaceae bacterium]|nr:hypothetical protein [Synergistaceae bacterium]